MSDPASWRLVTRWLALLALAGSALPLARTASAHPPAIHNQAAEAATGAEIADFLDTLKSRLARKDRRDLARLYSDGFSHVDAAGRQRSRDAHVAAISDGEAVVEAAEIAARTVRSPNGWTAVVTGRARLQPGTGPLRITIVLTRAGQSWQIAATHVTAIEPPDTTRNPNAQR